MKPSYVARRRVRAAVTRQIEMLESRCLLSATVISQIPSQEVVTTSAPTMITLSTYMGDPQLTGGTVVDMDTPLGNIPLQLTDSQTPMTVANFVSYVTNGQYTPTVWQRSVPGFVLQGGGTMPDGATNNPTGTVNSEAHYSNTTGTIAMALSSGPDSGSNQWFINLANNNGTNVNSSGQQVTPDLDDTADGGPFTVFGDVIDSGMSVVGAIVALPIVNAGAENGNWTALPVTGGGFTNGQTVTSVPQANIVTDNVVVIPTGQAVTYSASSSNSSIIIPTVTDGVLSLAAAPGVTSGVATITTTATDLSGNSVSESFAVSVNGFVQPITIGSGGSKSVTYKDADGTTGVFTVKGPGSAVVDFMGNSSISNSTTKQGNTTVTSSSGLSVADINVTGTSASSTLTITTRGGTHTIDVPTINTDALKSLTATGVALTGNLTSSSTIGTLSLASAQGGTIAATSIGTVNVPGTFSDGLELGGTGVSLNKFTAGSIAGGSWGASGSVNSITAKSASSWDPDITGALAKLTINGNLSGMIQAGSIKTLSIAGTLDASIFTQSITTVMVRKDLSDSDLDISGTGTDLGKLSVGGSITGTTVNATGSIGPVSATSLDNSELFAGVAAIPAGQLPSSGTEFVTPESITSVTLKTVKSADSFSNSDIAASSLGKLSLGSIMTSNGGTANGVASEAIAAFAATANGTRISLKNITPSTDLSTFQSELVDFKIEIF